MVNKLLEESLGVKPRIKGTNRSDFEEFCGIWSDSELAEFEENTKDLRSEVERFRVQRSGLKIPDNTYQRDRVYRCL